MSELSLVFRQKFQFESEALEADKEVLHLLKLAGMPDVACELLGITGKLGAFDQLSGDGCFEGESKQLT